MRKPLSSFIPTRHRITLFALSILLSLPLSYFFSFFHTPTPTLLSQSRSVYQDEARCCGPGCRVYAKNVDSHYDQKYFDWQTKLGLEAASERDWTAFFGVEPHHVVADLGAGGGHILASINCSRRIAVEINPVARAAMNDMYEGKIEAYAYAEDIEDGVIDVLFSKSAIEHFECPVQELREMARKVKVGGRVIIGVKNEGPRVLQKGEDNDLHMHLWTWNRQLLYNLVKVSGFVVEDVGPTDDEIRTAAAKWKTEVEWAHYDTFVYMWAKGIKKEKAKGLGSLFH